jgi:hypothetical protein
MNENSQDVSAGNPASNPAEPAPAGQPKPGAPNDEEVGDEGIVQVDAGDDSFLVDLPPRQGGAADAATPAKKST